MTLRTVQVPVPSELTRALGHYSTSLTYKPATIFSGVQKPTKIKFPQCHASFEAAQYIKDHHLRPSYQYQPSTFSNRSRIEAVPNLQHDDEHKSTS